MFTSKTKRSQKKGMTELKKRILITVNVVGSAGPIRFIVNEDDVVVDVVVKALKIYAREGRLPVLGLDANDFMLLCPTAGSDLMDPLEKIGSSGTRNFLLCKKPRLKTGAEDVQQDAVLAKSAGAGKGTGALKSWSWISKSLKVVISAQ